MPPGMTGTHEYDFGSTTPLLITSHRSVRLNCGTGDDVMVIARNTPVACEMCEREPATTLTPTAGVITDPDGQRYRGILHVPLCRSCSVPAEPDDADIDCDEECGICDAADQEYAGPIPMVNSPRLYDADCFVMTGSDEVPQSPRLRGINGVQYAAARETDAKATDHATAADGETDMYDDEDDEFFARPGPHPRQRRALAQHPDHGLAAGFRRQVQ